MPTDMMRYLKPDVYQCHRIHVVSQGLLGFTHLPSIMVALAAASSHMAISTFHIQPEQQKQNWPGGVSFYGWC
jgi:hypothetical protein